MIKQYRKKPIIIDAVQLTDNNIYSVKQWCGADFYSDPPSEVVTGLVIHTLEGDMIAPFGVYIIKGVQGEFYPCKLDIFQNTYEEVN